MISLYVDTALASLAIKSFYFEKLYRNACIHLATLLSGVVTLDSGREQEQMCAVEEREGGQRVRK